VQLLEDELGKIQEQLSLKEKALNDTSEIGEENQRMKSTLQSFTLESKDMMISINDLEKENDALKQNIRAPQAEASTVASTAASIPTDIKKIQSEFFDLKKQYAELEERYLELKMGK
jgi:chromosome segregation ATPase